MMNLSKSLNTVLAHKSVPAGVNSDKLGRMISKFVTRYAHGAVTSEDIASEALIALHSAIGAFDAGECSDVASGFEAFVWHRMREACRGFARANMDTINGASRKRFDGGETRQVSGDAAETILVSTDAMIPNPETLCIAKQAIEALWTAVERIQEGAKREVLRSFCDETETQAALAARLGISQQAISKKRKAALNELAHYVTDVQAEIGAALA